ncbi:tRNA uridine-5-carboxymethylaminomethyl(34) synthesis GTPase MnmE [Luteithermobacter gelatinilyticus]|uniref:tRNA uridine-5-carboxymethylaminomethyl(34) synthesis GTPase MnmE n=1 Tax=Luteithermobacter gelatinilyticus TaxID=2582913 RepID=UPI0011057F37|nr:tRNA uridine-5-carboxymethylaminomethyl(34) synthesis GTPase MnmE [Luteithermobacter gelatinilyticus]|tara:strand:- start:1560 stop:2906 length:1347 start_codon:yes stop_codon:yes gene_type:complete
MTIFALSSGKGRAGVAVIRLSGPQTATAVRTLTRKHDLPVPREACLRWFYDPQTGHRLDQGLVLYFPAPHSFTGEAVAEFHIHGGRAVIAGFLEALGKIPGVRPAEPGEFTRRAFDHGKMDLTAIEGLADLINAETEAQRRQALRQMDGRLAALYEGWRRDITAAMAYLEADIDFADEEIPEDVTAQVRPRIEQLRARIAAHLDDNHKGERIRDGLQVVILGAPNVGKSTLLNFLSRRDVAIVSDIAGTTRDILEVHLDIAGYPVTVVDTAGIRESADVIEAEGIRRAERRAREADLKVIMLEAADWPDISPRSRALIDENSMILLNKVDLAPIGERSGLVPPGGALGVWQVSAKQETGLEGFLKALAQEVERRMDLSDTPSLTRTRHRLALKECLDHLDRYLNSAHQELELLAEDLRLAARSLGKITGRVDVEDILDVVFSEFCIGK